MIVNTIYLLEKMIFIPKANQAFRVFKCTPQKITVTELTQTKHNNVSCKTYVKKAALETTLRN